MGGVGEGGAYGKSLYFPISFVNLKMLLKSILKRKVIIPMRGQERRVWGGWGKNIVNMKQKKNGRNKFKYTHNRSDFKWIKFSLMLNISDL